MFFLSYFKFSSVIEIWPSLLWAILHCLETYIQLTQILELLLYKEYFTVDYVIGITENSFKWTARIWIFLCMCVCMYVGFKTSFYVVRHLDSTVSYLPTGLHLGFFHSWPSLYFPSSFSSVFLVLSFVSASTSLLFWVIFLLSFFEHIRTM